MAIDSSSRNYFELAQLALEEVSKVMVGQKDLLEKLMIGLLADGHVLVEGVPGLAKTTAVKTLSDVIDSNFSRIQFTPDLLPADLIGTQVYRPETGDFNVKKGPVFSNFVLADEINRAPAKVQSALLEAMQEKQVSIGDETFKLPSTFLVMATQNPVEQEGTYPLPEAQVDRFMFKVNVDYNSFDEEVMMAKRVCDESFQHLKVNKILNPEVIREMRSEVNKVFVDDKIYNYIAEIIFSTRQPKDYGLDSIDNLIEFGASPRATINFIKASRARAFMNGRSFVTPEDVKSISFDVLRHRVSLSYEADAQEIVADEIISKVIAKIRVP
tara:strand:- start:189 stop:1169 length:981 start_codon:yes stop_codon:yes gene_type:complete